jgi:uncharacterized protein YcbK (DUF882 family)
MLGPFVATALLGFGLWTHPGAPLPLTIGTTLSRNDAPARRASTALPDDTLLGRSGKLRARFLPTPQARELERVIGAVRASENPSPLESRLAMLNVLHIVPFEFKVDGWLGMYRMGFWPGELSSAGRRSMYDAPTGFVEVTLQNRDLQISEHFRLRDFVTKDQANVWPKYVVLRESLIDKLELVIDELQRMGYPVQRLQIMSGFRHPFYNAQGVGAGGRARESRHQYGDASDVFADSDGDGWLDDLDGDGRVTVLDADLMVLAVERVEMAHPELIGGMGRYHATHAHGPFVHIDVRGRAARWGGA